MHDESNELVILSAEDLTSATGGHSPQALRQSGFANQAAYNRYLHYSGIGAASSADTVRPLR